MRMLALDQAAKITGWSIWEDGELIEHGLIKIPPSKPIEERLNLIFKALNELDNRYNGDIDEIVFEDIQYQNNAQTYKILAYVQATIMIWCYNNDKKFRILGPSHWRSVLGGGFGRTRVEQKKNSIQYVRDMFKEDVSEDEADSICIGHAAIKEKKNVVFGQ